MRISIACIFVFMVVYQSMVSGQPPPPPLAPAMSSFMGPMPSTTICSDDDTMVKPKFLNDSCSTDEECGYVMQCVKGICACNDQYIQHQLPGSGPARYTCEMAPFMSQPCTDICQKPLRCAAATDSSIVTSDIRVRQLISTKTCQCFPPAILRDGMCYLECPKDELYENGECKKRCSAEQVRMEKRGCMKKVALDEPCEDSRQCSVPYSECVNGKAQCKSGFSPNKGVCVAKSYSCPSGDPIMNNDAIVECKLVKSSKIVLPVPMEKPMGNVNFAGANAVPQQPMPMDSRMMVMPPYNNEFEDTCGEGNYCVLPGNIAASEGATGHCCPKPKPQCPVGSPHPNASCNYKQGEKMPNCPYQTHYCVYNYNGPYGGNVGLCCPSACNNGEIMAVGKCLPQVQFGDACVADEQCRGHNGACRSGTCSCSGDTREDGNGLYKYCRLQCQLDEMEYNNKCYPRFKLGDTCQQGTMQCPINSYCNSKNICACRCGFEALGDKICGAPPTCDGGFPMPVPLMMASNSGPTSNNAAASETKSNFTHCKVSPGAKSALDSAVDQCPAGQLCAYYMEGLGVCCPTPKPSCPSGNPIGRKCDPRTGCGMNAWCYRYFTPANSTDMTIGFACCPVLSGPIN